RLAGGALAARRRLRAARTLRRALPRRRLLRLFRTGLRRRGGSGGGRFWVSRLSWGAAFGFFGGAGASGCGFCGCHVRPFATVDRGWPEGASPRPPRSGTADRSSRVAHGEPHRDFPDRENDAVLGGEHRFKRLVFHCNDIA